MIRLSWNEIRDRALKFSNDWADETNEHAEAKTFWDEFFSVFGLQRRNVASFEEPVKNIKGKYGFIDLFWPGNLLVEHKSKGKDLSKAASQAFKYIQDLETENRFDEIPRFIVISDFSKFVIYDLDTVRFKDERTKEDASVSESSGMYGIQEFPLSELHKNVRAFSFLNGEKPVIRNPEDPANIKAAEIMGKLHTELDKGGFKGHDLERFLVRVLFCLFSEDSMVFEPNQFAVYLQNHTRPDGSDLGPQLNRLFDVLNTPVESRQHSLDEDLAAFPYINGDLFKERLAFPDFNKNMRDALMRCTRFNWGLISPAVFGSMFQSIMEDEDRRGLGAHYTSEKDILKIIHSLFLNDLWAEFNFIKADKTAKSVDRLKNFQGKLATLKFLDPACGCGNFLVITYREIRLLELEVLKSIYGTQTEMSLGQINTLSKVDVNQMFGMEIAECPARIAEVALWLMDHQMNQEISNAFHQHFLRIPLKRSPHIICANALRINWNEIIDHKECSYILGNPPFIGKKLRNDEQQADMDWVFGNAKGIGVLDYVCCWYRKAAEYIQNTKIGVGFVSTNSITQGEQPGTLWHALFEKFHVKIWFGYRTFPWESEARGKAHVHVVIIGFGAFDKETKYIFELSDDEKSFIKTEVRNISPYISEGPDKALTERDSPISPNIPEMNFGNMPNDGGNFLLNDDEKNALEKQSSRIRPVIKRFLSSKEYLHSISRWCIWLKDVSPKIISEIPEIRERVERVKDVRSKSDRKATKKLAAYPSLFGEIRQPDEPFVLIPRHCSENRLYIPMSYFTPDNIVADSCLFLPKASCYHFGVLTSGMHMSWIKQVCGRIKSDFRYSIQLVYNNFPWPDSPTDKQIQRVESAVINVLEVREKHQDLCFADLYDLTLIPPDLTKAHMDLDRAVEKCYREEPFENERVRFEYLFNKYLNLSEPLMLDLVVKKKGKKVLRNTESKK